jgi:hypothetical protein
MAKPSDSVKRKSPESPGWLQDPYDFSLVLGGPLYQLLRRAYGCDEALELLGRRILVISLLAWLPLLVRSVWAGQALGLDWPEGISTANIKRRSKTPLNEVCRTAPVNASRPAAAGNAVPAAGPGLNCAVPHIMADGSAVQGERVATVLSAPPPRAGRTGRKELYA